MAVSAAARLEALQLLRQLGNLPSLLLPLVARLGVLDRLGARGVSEVESVSRAFSGSEWSVASITVTVRPPNDSSSSRVSFDERYGTWDGAGARRRHAAAAAPWAGEAGAAARLRRLLREGIDHRAQRGQRLVDRRALLRARVGIVAGRHLVGAFAARQIDDVHLGGEHDGALGGGALLAAGAR